MRPRHRSTRHHLRLIQGDAPAIPSPRPPSPHLLAANIVRAAQEWAAAALAETTMFDRSTEEGRLRLAVLDAVQNLEYYSSGAILLDVEEPHLDLDMGPGTPGA